MPALQPGGFVKTTLNRPTRPDPLEPGSSPSFDLRSLATELLAEPGVESSGRSAVTLVSHPGLTVLLTALKEGGSLAEHRAPGPTAITCVVGRVTFDTENGEEEVVAGSAIAFSPKELHSVRAKEDSAILIVIGPNE